MISKRLEGEFLSSDGVTNVKYSVFIPDTAPRAVIQICHGMWEHMGRYEENGLVKALTDSGIAVCGNDHVGHGRTASENGLGHFTDFSVMTDDMRTLRLTVKKKYPRLPYILLGHGFGALLVRAAAVEQEDIDGIALVGTTAGDTPLGTARISATLIGVIKGKTHRSPYLRGLLTGGLNTKFLSEKDSLSFRSSIPDVRSSMRYDGKCGFEYSTAAYKAVIDLASSVCSSEWVSRVPLSLPVYLMWGEDDPATGCGEGARQLYAALEDREINDLKFDSFAGRHDIFSDVDRENAIKKLIEWTDSVCEGVVACRSYGALSFGRMDF